MTLLYINGDYKTNDTPLIFVNDCGFTTGIGVFDSMLAKDGALVHGLEHFARLQHDAQTVIGLAPSWDYTKFEDICLTLLNKNKLTKNHARIRTEITGGIVHAPLAMAQNLTRVITVAPADNPDNIAPIKCAVITAFPRIAGCALENCKRLDYSRSYAARRAAEKLGAAEAILTNTNGHIACAATSNIFIEENGDLITPPLIDGALAGITRHKILEQGNTREESISIESLKSADKIYLTNSFIGLREATLI